MKYRKAGKSSLELSEIGFGCMSLRPGDVEATAVIHHAIEKGINFFDTADLYDKGENELLVGKALAGKRKQVILATKVGNQWRPDGSGWDWNPRKEYILASIDRSLERLQTDYIDLYQLHGGTINDPIDETIEALELLKQQGKIRFYGISSIRPNVIDEYVRRSSIVTVMMQYGLLDRRPEERCTQLLKENGIGVLARGALAKGLLVDKQEEPFLSYDRNDVKAAADAVKKVSGKSRTPAQTAIQFVLSNEAVTSAVVGIRTMQQLNDVVDVSESAPLDADKLKMLRSAVDQNFYAEHR